MQNIFFNKSVLVLYVKPAPKYENTRVVVETRKKAQKSIKSKTMFSNTPKNSFKNNVVNIPNKAIGTPQAAAVAMLPFIDSP